MARKKKKYKPLNDPRYPLRIAELKEMAMHHPSVWKDRDGAIRYNTIYGNQMRFHFIKTKMRVEIHHKEIHRWRRVDSYPILHITDMQWERCLNYIDAMYA